MCSEEAALEKADVSPLKSLLGSEKSQMRLQASATLLAFGECRSDSADVLSALIPDFVLHAEDQASRVALNSVNTMGMLRPDIPSDALRCLIRVLGGTNEDLAAMATRGVARMATNSPDATQALDSALSQHRSASLQLAAIQAISALRSYGSASPIKARKGGYNAQSRQDRSRRS